MTRLFLCLLLLFAVTSSTPALAQTPRLEMPKLKVDVRRIEVDGQRMYEVDASGTVQAPPASVWKTLTTYERMSEFVPDMSSCRVLSRNGNEVIIEQQGVARFLFMNHAIHLVVRATETPLSAINIDLISGDMRHYEASWNLYPIPETGGTRIVFNSRLMPGFYVPGMLGPTMIRGDIERMMNAVLARIDSPPVR
ncbi:MULTISPECIES: SRPBCC family protein [unclassified Janthinobacterium]|uniref:SRPBCC family protein n=1 Tax=unclassified Janthinobacterium TaxID=2610881 RepID=UPI00180F0E26|nr:MULTISPECIES: SRPBCC family protein [unclassified Janthinobacterium]MBB5370222.1 ribosome-associated toxin RatA of RatAB toxin-antitoxin module [Janthinobacterium sp. K2C7]MBB5383028.1 ribosome-associated toxin RatA of RatAB toxin-antitoxin module [Janthinobacterium sp. K2Li3]MBB5388493.1 ribosome-associated toxin RatA of RatAB toxin-antitoxin module [Janthinobacterium sp. K2E3]